MKRIGGETARQGAPVIPAPMRDALERAMNPVARYGTEDLGMLRPSIPLPRDLWGMAQEIGDEIAEQIAPRVTDRLLASWLAPVNFALRNPQEPAAFARRVSALAAMLDDLPACVFTADARRRLPEFFPAHSDIRAAVEPEAKHLRAMLAGLRKIPVAGQLEVTAVPLPENYDVAAVKAFRERQRLRDGAMARIPNAEDEE